MIAGERAQPGPERYARRRRDRALMRHVDHLEPRLLRDVFGDHAIAAQPRQEAQQHTAVTLEQARQRRIVAIALKAEHELGIFLSGHTREVVISTPNPTARTRRTRCRERKTGETQHRSIRDCAPLSFPRFFLPAPKSGRRWSAARRFVVARSPTL